MELQRKVTEDVRIKEKQLSKLNEYHMPKHSSKKLMPEDGSDDEKSFRSATRGVSAESRRFERIQADIAKIEEKLRIVNDADK